MISRKLWSLPVAGTTLAPVAATNALEAPSGAGVGSHGDDYRDETAGKADIVGAAPGRCCPCEKRV